MENKCDSTIAVDKYSGLKTPEPVRKEFEFGQSMDFQEELDAGQEMMKDFFDQKQIDNALRPRFENKR